MAWAGPGRSSSPSTDMEDMTSMASDGMGPMALVGSLARHGDVVASSSIPAQREGSVADPATLVALVEHREEGVEVVASSSMLVALIGHGEGQVDPVASLLLKPVVLVERYEGTEPVAAAPLAPPMSVEAVSSTQRGAFTRACSSRYAKFFFSSLPLLWVLIWLFC